MTIFKNDYQGDEISKAFNIHENYGLHLLRIALRACDSGYRWDNLVSRFGTNRCDIAKGNLNLPYNVESKVEHEWMGK